MGGYITGGTIKALRERKGYTQAKLAELLSVSDKAVSKWETGKGLPDVTLIEPLAKALGVSLIELMSGDAIENRNVSGNLLRSRFYVCPVCGNILHASGSAVVSCCGITLPPLVAEECDEMHAVTVESVEDEHFITVHHEMTKGHYISFLAYVTTDRVQLVKFYPEGNAQTRLNLRGMGRLYLYCNRHGLMQLTCNRARVPAGQESVEGLNRLCEEAKKLLRDEREGEQAICLQTAAGKIYSFVNRNIVAGDTADEERFLAMLRETGDTEVERLVCLWREPCCVDVPSAHFRQGLMKLSHSNEKAQILLRGEAGLMAKTMGDLRPFR